jgi:aminoglycoside 3-N-acetyltransferase
VRFAAWGKKVDYLFSEQPWMYAFGRGSALERLVELQGKILLLGSDHDAVTFLHYAEHIAEIPEKRIVRFQVPVLVDGRRVWKVCEEVNSNTGAHASWPDRYFATLTDAYLERTENRGGRVGNAESYLIPAREFLDFVLPDMEKRASPVPGSVRKEEL